jgi:hypothetical protein
MVSPLAPDTDTPPSPPPAPPSDPNSDEKFKQQIEAARGVAYHFLRGAKMIGMYRHNESKYGEYLSNAHAALTKYVDEFGSLQLTVNLTNFQMHRQDLFSEDSQMPFKFFKDGIRQLIFNPGFTVEELTTFTLISLSDPDRGAEDLNVQLWQAQMPHFEYIMIEGFRMDEFTESEVQVEVDSVVDYLQRRLRAASDDFLRFARVTEADLDMKLDNVDQMRGAVITGVTADAAFKARVQKEVHDEETQRLFPKLISAVFQVVESGVDDAEFFTDMFSQLLDAMLLQEDFMIINQVVLKLKAMEQRLGPDSAVGRLSRNFISNMGEETRVNRVADIIKTSRLKNPQEIVRYLSNLGLESVPLWLDALEVIELPENRLLLCDVLVPFAKSSPDEFVSRLQSDRPQTVRDMIYILDRANHPEKIRFFSSVLNSKNLAVKLDAMSIIARGRTGEARNMIAALLDDGNQQVRIQAARVLPEFDRERAFLDLMKLVRAPQFEKRHPEEREAIYSAIGSTGVTGALAYFTQLLQVKGGLFNKEKVKQDKLLAVSGLGGACSIQTAKLLQEVIEDRDQPAEVTNLARRHLSRVRKVLFGSTDKES